MYLIWVTCLGVPEVKAFDIDVLLLIVPDSAHTMHTPIILGTLHIDIAIILATKKELENLNKQWNRSLVTTKLTMKEETIDKPGRCTNCVSDRQFCENYQRCDCDTVWNH